MFVAVAEELPEVFRTHVVRKLGLVETLNLAKVNKFYNAAVWSVEAVRSLDEKAEDYCKITDETSAWPPLHVMVMSNNLNGLRALLSAGVDLEQREYTPGTALLFAVHQSFGPTIQDDVQEQRPILEHVGLEFEDPLETQLLHEYVQYAKLSA